MTGEWLATSMTPEWVNMSNLFFAKYNGYQKYFLQKLHITLIISVATFNMSENHQQFFASE